MTKPEKKRFIVLLADGARYDVFRELLDAGELPRISEVFLREGNFVPATSVFPSTTGPAYMPFLTGCFPGTCNVPGIRWFDKKTYGEKIFSLKRFRSYVGLESFLMNQDMAPEVETLFERFAASFNIFSSVNRGVSYSRNLSAHMRIWYWYYAHLTDRWHLVDGAALKKTLRVIRQDFEFLFVVFPAIDEYTHLSHCRYPEALKAYRGIDDAIGAMADALKREGKYEETALFIVSDHGLSEVKEHFGVASFLEDRGIKTFYYPKILKWNFQAATMVSGNGMLNLYFRDEAGWKRRMTTEELRDRHSEVLRELLEHPAVDLMLSQDDQGRVLILSREGECRVEERGRQRIHFENLRGDIFQVGVPSATMDFSEAMEKTVFGPYPDGLVQALQLFRSPRAGDLVISATKGYDLRKRFEYPEHKSSHGALHREHMLIPFFSSVPVKRPFVRSVDLYPSILELARQPFDPEALDGTSFL